MSYSENDNRLMSNNLSPWVCFEGFCIKKNISLGLKLFIKFMFRYSFDSHIEFQWLELFSEFSIIWSLVITSEKWKSFCLKRILYIMAVWFVVQAF